MERIEEQIKQEVPEKNCIGARLKVKKAELKESNFHYQEEMNKKEKKYQKTKEKLKGVEDKLKEVKN